MMYEINELEFAPAKKYLAISNPGVADYRGLTIVGVSTTRYANRAGTVGMFGSGTKYSIALLLRYGVDVHITAGRLKMHFFTKKFDLDGNTFHQVWVTYDGQDIDGKNKGTTEALGFTAEMGEKDWTHHRMALREIVSNAIDAATVGGGSYKDVGFKLTEKPRAARDETTFYLELTPEIEEAYKLLKGQFLHFSNPELLDKKILPKRNPEEIRVYKRGVLVHCQHGESLNDYNLEEIELDESRNAKSWDVEYAVGLALRDETPDTLAKTIRGLLDTPDVWEGNHLTVSNNSYVDQDTQDRRKQNFQEAWAKAAGPKAVVTSSRATASFVEQKGFIPVTVKGRWAEALESYDVQTETKVLTRNELDGKNVADPTEAMLDCTKVVWKLIETFDKTGGKGLPGVKGFTNIMDGGSVTRGYFLPGGTDIYLEKSLSGKHLFKVTLEETVHYITGSTDGSRDLQQWLFDLITEMAF